MVGEIKSMSFIKRHSAEHGFTLIEVLIVLVIVAILAAVAIPSYQSSVLKSRRTDAKETLLAAAAMQEQKYMQANQYSGSAADIGGSESAGGYYAISITQPCGNTCFLITATAQNAQADDTNCYRFTIDQAGTKRSYSRSGGTETNDCW